MDTCDRQIQALKKNHAEDREIWRVDANLRIGMSFIFGVVIGMILATFYT